MLTPFGPAEGAVDAVVEDPPPSTAVAAVVEVVVEVALVDLDDELHPASAAAATSTKVSSKAACGRRSRPGELIVWRFGTG